MTALSEEQLNRIAEVTIDFMKKHPEITIEAIQSCMTKDGRISFEEE